MQKISKSVPDVKVTGWWITSCLVDIGEFSLHENWALISSGAFHSSSSVLENSINSNRNRTGSIPLTCLNPTLKSMAV